MTELSTPLSEIKGIGPKISQALEKKGLRTFEDALYFLPRDYEDRTQITHIASLKTDHPATIFGEVLSSSKQNMRFRSTFKVLLDDGTGIIELFWFHPYPGLEKDFTKGEKILAFGEVKQFQQQLQIVHPDYEVVKDKEVEVFKTSEKFGKVLPVYSETEGVGQKTLRKMMDQVVTSSLSSLVDPISKPLRDKFNLPELKESFKEVHFPHSPQTLKLAYRDRIILDEFFILQLGLSLKKQKNKTLKSFAMKNLSSYSQFFLKTLPFSLTSDQQLALTTIEEELSKETSMVRLIQGDVGCGKTIVALTSAYGVIKNGYQVALLAPTEILAQQHFHTAKKFLKDEIAISLVTHQSKPNSTAKLFIGTHALLQQNITFSNLAYVIVDEQHRFGVDQRNELLKKSDLSPHLLMMTATPIPRTLSLTLYGDLDLTLIKEKPKERKQIKTSILRESQRTILYQKIHERVLKGEQVYIIYPLVEESEKLALKSATEMFEKLTDVFKNFKLGLLHGRIKSQEKESILNKFQNKEFQILVATTVVEVGIDIANATLMVIEHPERLGLSQLHQLRGRVGRSSLDSECILVASQFVTQRLKVMVQSDDGFEIAEEDLKIRGPGEFLGTKQHGLNSFKVANLVRDGHLLELAKKMVTEILNRDPYLEAAENILLKKLVESQWKDKIDRLRSG